MADPLDEMVVVVAVDRVVNRAEVTVYPVETIGGLEVLWAAQTELHIAPGTTRVLSAPFRDSKGERVGAVDVVEPVAGTDYVYEYHDVVVTGLGILDVTATVEATRVVWVLENTSGWATLDVTTLQIRGYPVVVYDAIVLEEEDSGSQAEYEVRAARLDLPMQSDPNFGLNYAQYLVGRFAEPVLVAERLGVRNRDVVQGVNIFSLGLFDKVLVNDGETGLGAAAHWIVGVEYVVWGGGFEVAFLLERADDQVYCYLDVTGYCELGSVKVGF